MINLSHTIRWGSTNRCEAIVAKIDCIGLVGSESPQLLLADDGLLDRIATGKVNLKFYHAVLLRESQLEQINLEKMGVPLVVIPPTLEHLGQDDVVRIEPHTNRLRVLFKKRFRHNSLLITERCNNYCVMCSQPPRDVDDSWIAEELYKVIPLLPKDTPEIGITGGEPTLLGDDLLRLIRLVKNQLPNTALHILTNGRRFANAEFARRCGEIGHPDLMFGIPIYSDNYIDHDYVVQAQGGFAQAIQGIYNLKRFGVRVEIRFVIHRETFKRLPQFADFVTRNLTFVDHVALMGYEAMGFGKSNAKQLFILPSEFGIELNSAVRLLQAARIRTSIYNLPLCLLKDAPLRLAVQSISDWKNEYLPACDKCSLKTRCAGFFTSTKHLYEGNVKPVSEEKGQVEELA